jgi:hypothetical protein
MILNNEMESMWKETMKHKDRRDSSRDKSENVFGKFHPNLQTQINGLTTSHELQFHAQHGSCNALSMRSKRKRDRRETRRQREKDGRKLLRRGRAGK